MNVRRVAEVFARKVAVGLLASADLANELAIGGEVQHHVIAPAVAADPHVQVIVDIKAVDVGGPLLVAQLGTILPLTLERGFARCQIGAAPAAQQVAVLIELQDVRRRAAAGDALPIVRAKIAETQGIGAVEHPDIIVPVHGKARSLSQDHVLR